MAPHQQRVVDELNELRDKRKKLEQFLFSENPVVFNQLPADEQDRMRRQFDIMLQYEGVLQERIDQFPAG
jgi:hypothetical protein